MAEELDEAKMREIVTGPESIFLETIMTLLAEESIGNEKIPFLIGARWAAAASEKQ